MKTLLFLFIVTIHSPDGERHVEILDYNLTGWDCIAAVEEFANWEAKNPQELFMVPSCELDVGDY